MSEQDRTQREIEAALAARFRMEQEMKLNNYRQLNAFVPKGGTLFTGSSLMELFPIAEYCMDEGIPAVYNRGIGGYTTDDFLAAIGPMLLDPEPSRVFINIGTNDIREMPDGEDWFDHLSGNYRKICGIIRDRLPEAEVYMMAYYPVNPRGSSPALRVRTNEAVDRANGMVRRLAEEFGYRYIDVGGGLKDGEGNLRAEHTADGIHFDAAAYRTVFDRLKQYL
jgi:lysophospholipase L1-like esterase